MTTTRRKLDRLSIDIDPKEHIKIKTFAAISGKTIREYVLESVREHVRQQMEAKDLYAMTMEPMGALSKRWDYEKMDKIVVREQGKEKKITKQMIARMKQGNV